MVANILPIDPPWDCRQNVKIQLFQNMVMLIIIISAYSLLPLGVISLESTLEWKACALNNSYTL